MNWVDETREEYQETLQKCSNQKYRVMQIRGEPVLQIVQWCLYQYVILLNASVIMKISGFLFYKRLKENIFYTLNHLVCSNLKDKKLQALNLVSLNI